MSDYYELLGVPKTADAQEIRKAYKKLAIKHHPDKNPNDKQQAKERFTKISEAYAVLYDPKKRADYDNPPPMQSARFEYNWKNPEFNPEYKHFNNDFFQGFIKSAPGNFFSSNLFQAPSFMNDLSSPFGSFTFDMAEKIFSQVFRGENVIPNLKPRELPHNVNQNLPPTTLMKRHSQPYKPKNSTLLEEKVVQRNGKRVLIKKYSITQNGITRKETHEQIVRNN